MVCLTYYYVTESHAYDFEVKDFVIKRDVVCVRPCIVKINDSLNEHWKKCSEDNQENIHC